MADGGGLAGAGRGQWRVRSVPARRVGRWRWRGVRGALDASGGGSHGSWRAARGRGGEWWNDGVGTWVGKLRPREGQGRRGGVKIGESGLEIGEAERGRGGAGSGWGCGLWLLDAPPTRATWASWG